MAKITGVLLILLSLTGASVLVWTIAAEYRDEALAQRLHDEHETAPSRPVGTPRESRFEGYGMGYSVLTVTYEFEVDGKTYRGEDHFDAKWLDEELEDMEFDAYYLPEDPEISTLHPVRNLERNRARVADHYVGLAFLAAMGVAGIWLLLRKPPPPGMTRQQRRRERMGGGAEG